MLDHRTLVPLGQAIILAVRQGEILAGHKFKRGNESGVELTETSRNTISGRFIEEKVETEILVDPFGEEIRNEVLRFTVFGFSISRFERRVFLLRLTDPPRNLKSFVDFLARIVGFGLSVDVLPIDVQGFLADLRGYPGATLLRIKKIRLGTIRISDATLARMDAASTSDALADVSSLVSLAGTVVEKATVSFCLDESLHTLEVAATAARRCGLVTHIMKAARLVNARQRVPQMHNASLPIRCATSTDGRCHRNSVPGMQCLLPWPRVAVWRAMRQQQ